MNYSCEQTSANIDAHFAARSNPTDEAELRRHMLACDACHNYYERYLLLARFDRKIASPKQRLRAGLRFESTRKRNFWLLTGSSFALATACLALFFTVRLPSRHAAFETRSGVFQPQATIQIYEVVKGRAQLAGSFLSADAELAFTYRNPENFSHLMIFAVDSSQQIYWYYPAWTRAPENPSSLAIRPTEGWVELSEAVKQPMAAGQVMLYALFSHAAYNVQDLERAFRAGDLLAPNSSDRLVAMRLTVKP